jgi:hypothetical protein
MIIQYGFISQLIFILFQIYKMSFKKKTGFHGGLFCLEIVVAAVWLTQFIMLIVYRFSHTGKVCSGDYTADSMINSSDVSGSDQKYNVYYLRQEGDFFYYYIISIAYVLLGLVVLAICLGSILFMAGSFTALTFADNILSNFDNLPEMMRGGAPGGPGRGSNDNNFKKADDDEEKSEEQKFAEEFKDA